MPAPPTMAEGIEEEDYDDPLQVSPQAGSCFAQALGIVLTHLAKAGVVPTKVTSFHCVRPPPLSIEEYLARIHKYFQCSNEAFVLSLIYIDRIVKLHPEFTICELNIHRLLMTAVMLGAKFFDDVYYSNAYYAKVGGIRTKEANALEFQFLKLIDWSLHVTTQEYEQYRKHVYTAVGGQGQSALCMAPAKSSDDMDCDA
eukprot:TRINITY_DN17792_c0_g1_i1.p1 TRINITY_DN17792_c0_g1~~TRINITY_DN17792_c0_g1_i1.p1  ORF type:complete len:199 (+),score=39.15 TRINITY_DN17792_c0_g1_i1:192-788(+)